MTEKAIVSRDMQQAGELANGAAAQTVFADYRSRQADNTLRRQDADLRLFAEYLESVGVEVGQLNADPSAWAGLAWGLLDGFSKWQLAKGYAVGSINVRLATVRRYAELANRAGYVSSDDLVKIRSVRGYNATEAKRIDTRRQDADLPTRIGTKKSESLLLTVEQAEQLKAQPDTPQGRRDALLMCLLIDHGLRVSEVAGLRSGDFDLTRREFRFYRPKVDKVQTHELTADTFKAARAYLTQDADPDPDAALLRGSRRGGRLTEPGVKPQRINKRIRVLGQAAGVENLSPHDCRHYWATTAARAGTPIDKLMSAGGWTNPTTPLTRYVEPAKIANEGVRLK